MLRNQRPPFLAMQHLISLSDSYIPYESNPAKAINLLEQVVTAKSVSGDPSHITKKDVCRAVCNAVGIPEEAISSPKERLQAMETVLNSHILGQQEVIAKLCRRLFISKAGMSVTPERPDGVFLLAGPTGVGKTELAKALATYMNGTDKALIRIDMSAFVDRSSVHVLLGSSWTESADSEPRGTPSLTRELRTRPYSVLLLDEIEKAHHSIHLLFLHAFDTGRMLDNLGNEISLRNTVVIMTTNLGFSVKQPIIGMPGEKQEDLVAEQERAAMKAIEEVFPKEFLGRIDEILFFKPLTREVMKGFVKQKIHQLEKITGKKIEVTAEAISLLCKRGFHPEYGARDLNRAIDELLGYKLALLRFSVDWESVQKVRVSTAEGNEELVLSV